MPRKYKEPKNEAQRFVEDNVVSPVKDLLRGKSKSTGSMSKALKAEDRKKAEEKKMAEDEVQKEIKKVRAKQK